jgi:AraC-like DNA-binding protein
MRYEEFQPDPVLRRSIECFWTIEANGDSSRSIQRILPDGCIEIILHAGEPFERLGEGNRWCAQPRCLVAGQLLRPIIVRPTRDARVIGIRFRPAGAKAILGVSAHELTGRTVPLDAVARPLRDQMESALARGRTVAARIASLNQVLSTRFRQLCDYDDARDATIEATVDATLAARGMIDVMALARGVNLSPRQLQRRFLEQVGLTPKMFCRIVRFQNVFRALESRSSGSWVSVALDCGYADQPHLVRDFKDFAGETPTALMAPRSDLAEAFLRKNRRVAFLQD